jgi:hypothetical protein
VDERNAKDICLAERLRRIQRELFQCVRAVIRYIDQQEAHHKKKSFDGEFIALLKRHGAEFDPRYVLDCFRDLCRALRGSLSLHLYRDPVGAGLCRAFGAFVDI